jgi:hypothetical protein
MQTPHMGRSRSGCAPSDAYKPLSVDCYASERLAKEVNA